MILLALWVRSFKQKKNDCLKIIIKGRGQKYNKPQHYESFLYKYV